MADVAPFLDAGVGSTAPAGAGSRNYEKRSRNYEIRQIKGKRVNPLVGMMALSQLICYYYLLGLRHWEILMFLQNEDGISISLSTLRRHLKSLVFFLIVHK